VQPLFLSIGITATLTACGIGWISLMTPRQRFSWLAWTVLGGWGGLALLLLVCGGFYLAKDRWTAGHLASPCIAALGVPGTAFWLASTFRAKRLRWQLEFWDGVTLIGASLGALAIASPMLDLSNPGFYYANNGEFVSYAALADITRLHPSGEHLATGLSILSREGLAGVLTAALSTVFGKSPLYVVEPLACSLAWLTLASVGLVFRAVSDSLHLSGFRRWLFAGSYGSFVFSCATLQFWTLSWLSQYLAMTLCFGCMAFLASEGLEAALTKGLTLAVATVALSLVYPEMAVLFLAFLAVWFVWSETGGWGTRLKVGLIFLAIVFGLVDLLGSRLIGSVVVERLARASTGPAGWNIYGSGWRAVTANLTGLGNPFYGPGGPWLSVLLVLGMGAAAAWGCRRLVRGAGNLLQDAVSGMYLLYLAGLMLLTLSLLCHRGNSYPVVKFAVTFIPVAYLAVGRWAAQSGNAGKLAWVLAVLILIPSVRADTRFFTAIRRDARLARFSEADGDECRRKLGGRSCYVDAPLWNYKLIGFFLAWKEDPLKDQDFLKYNLYDARESHLLFKDQEVVLHVGGDPGRLADRQLEAGYHRTSAGTSWSLWEKAVRPGGA
jgi:hypothetical protein